MIMSHNANSNPGGPGSNSNNTTPTRLGLGLMTMASSDLTGTNYAQYLIQLKSRDPKVQLKAAKDFYVFLLNELKQVKRDKETSFVDNLIPSIRELANENNTNISDKQACIYIITSIINLDNINVKVRKKHQTSLLRWLRNLLAYPDPGIIHMASRAMGKYVQAGVDCDVEFKSGLEQLRIDAKRYQAILLVRELSLAYPPRLFLSSVTFFQNIMYAICDHNAQIRYEAIELFRLSLIICVNHESLTTSSSSGNLSQRIRRTSTSSSLGSMSNQDQQLVSPSSINLNNSSNFNSQFSNTNISNDQNLKEFENCFKKSISDLEGLLQKYSPNSRTDTGVPVEDCIHGYLLIILEIVKFSCLDFEKQIDKYLSIYNLYYKQQQQQQQQQQSHQQSNGIYDNQQLARSCEEIHSRNLLKLLPHSYYCFDVLNTNDPFMFLFKTEKISVNIELNICKQLIASKYDKIVRVCLDTIKILNLSNFNSNNNVNFSTNAMLNSTANLSSFRCIQETIMSLLPRLARLNVKRFTSQYLKESLIFLDNLNMNTSFTILNSGLINSASGSAGGQNQSVGNISTPAARRQLNRSNITSTTSINSPIQGAPQSTASNSLFHNTNASFCLGTVKSEIIFCIGLMSLALKNDSEEFKEYARNYIESLRTNSIITNNNSLHRNTGAQTNASNASISKKEAYVNELNSIMACIAMCANSMLKQPVNSSSTMIKSIMLLLQPLMLCSGGITFTMRYFLNEISQHIPELKASIHENLLKILSEILTGKPLYQIVQNISITATNLTNSGNPLSSPTSSIPSSMSLIEYQQPIILTTGSNVDIEASIQALQTLRSFEFSSIYIIGFLRYCVDYYLQYESSNIVKIEAVLTTSTLLSRLINQLNAQDSRSLISIISSSLRKLLICAITDYDYDVRYNVLNSLDSDPKFNMFVSLPENLNILFMCVRDERAEIRELSASMISRLSSSNSADILPFIRKILMQLLTEVNIYPDISEREKSVRLMGHLLCHAPRLVNLYVKPLLDCLHTKLTEYRHDIPFASSIVTVVGQLASQSGPESIKHFDTVIPFLIESMQDFYYVQLKQTSLWAFGQIIANTGYVIEPYKKYPNLLEILFGFLQTEQNIQIRRETIRILGLLGAIDPFEYKKTLLKSKREELANAAINAAAASMQQLQNQHGNNGPDANNVINLQPGVTAAAQAAAIAANLNNLNNTTNPNNVNDLAPTYTLSFDPIEMLISMNSLDEYYSALAIHLMIKTTKNSVSIGVRKDASQALVLAMRSLDNRCVNYVELVIPPFLEIIKTINDDSAIELIFKLGNIIGYIKKAIEPYLNDILAFINQYWSIYENKQMKIIVALIDLIQSISTAMDSDFRRYLPQILPLILKQLKTEIDDGNCTNTPKILALLRSCTYCLDNCVHLILSQFATYLNKDVSTMMNASGDGKLSTNASNFKQEIMYTLYTFAKQITLSDNCAILFQSFIKILEANSDNLPPPSKDIINSNPILTPNYAAHINNHQNQQPPVQSISYILFTNSSNTGPTSLTNEKLNPHTELPKLTLETLYLLAKQMGSKFFVYSQMFDKILIKNKAYKRYYEQLMINCREATYHTLWNSNSLPPENRSPATDFRRQPSVLANNQQPTASQENNSQGGFRYQTVNFGNIKVCFDRAEHLGSKEGWRESFRKLMSSIVKETPIPTLRACSLIPYETVPPDLFNACFISIWVKLTQKEQDDIVKYLELALKNSYVPEIIKIILNLAEFIERCDIGYFLPLDYRLLAEKAFQVKAYAKALHYVEEQFHAVMASLNLNNMNNTGYLFSGVGGVSGAGGSSFLANVTNNNSNNSGTRSKSVTMFQTMSAMSVQQQQQTLIYLLEHLVTLNHELQKTEAAMGVLDFVSKYLKTLDAQNKVKERWNEKLHRWQKALTIYDKELKLEQPILTPNTPNDPSITSNYLDNLTESKLELIMGRIRCLNGLGEWNKLELSCNELLKALNNLNNPEIGINHSSPSSASLNTSPSMLSHARQLSLVTSPPGNIENIVIINSNTNSLVGSQVASTGVIDHGLLQLSIEQQSKLKEKIAEMGAAACWGLGDWGKMDNYVKYLSENSYDGSLYRTVLSLTNNSTNSSQNTSLLIERTRDLLDNDLTSMASQSYERSYQGIIDAQVLSELEELITYKNVPTKRDWLAETWWKRLQGCEKSLEHWHRLLLVRSIVLPKERNIKPWLKFSSMCQKAGHMVLSQQILNSLLSSEEARLAKANNPNQSPAINNLLNASRDYELCKYAQYKFNHANGNKAEAFEKLREFVDQNLIVQLNQCLQFQQHQQQMNNGVPMQNNPQQQQLSIREVQKRRSELEIQLAKCHLKLGKWYFEVEGFRDSSTINYIINFYEKAKDFNQQSYKAWLAWAYSNYEAIQFYRNIIATNHANNNIAMNEQLTQQRNMHVRPAIQGFFTCIRLSSLSQNQEANCLQDTLRLLTLLFDYCNSEDVFTTFNDGIHNTPMEIWLQVIPQLIARIDTNKPFVARLIQELLTQFGRVHPQALVYRLILASKGTTDLTSPAAVILNSLREHSNMLVEQAKLVSEELIRVSILWHERWHESLEEASKLYFGDKNVKGMLDTLEVLHNMMDRGATTSKETAFIHAYGRDLNEAREFCRRYLTSHNTKDIDLAWEKYYSVFKRITKQFSQMTTLELSYVSPRLMVSRDLELAIPGTYEPNKPIIKIKAFNANIQVIASKQRPRKISIFGSNGCEYVFLLKGHEDLRQDERVMQIFGLVNNLLLKNHETARRDLAIQRYSVIPLSSNSGLLEWLLNCDTLHSLIKEYRDNKKLLLNLEHKIITKLAPNYEHLTAIQKVQIFEMAIESTNGNDLAEILWHKSLTAEKWLERRTNYTRSLAVMSMVGYVLGLGDRHPSNLMLDRTNGKIIHVDFGDCFETAMNREKFPEKIPFRLTRMLKNAMEVTGIEGTFRRTCESVMKVLRYNRDSVMAVLEAFIYDPLVYWRLVEATNNQQQLQTQQANQQIIDSNEETEETNRKAIMVLNRVKDKLTGKDFGDTMPINEITQVDLLIRQATSSENLCQCFIGWCAWW